MNKLLETWKQKYSNQKAFCADGIINEEIFKKTTPRILYLEKEPNDPEHKGWDFRIWLNEDNLKLNSFFYRIIEWTYGILYNFPLYDKIWSKEQIAIGLLRNIAFMNVKKTGGKGSSSFKEMMQVVDRDQEEIREQIRLIKPNIIITGLTWKELRNTIFHNIKWQKSGYDIDLGLYENAKIIDFYHPSSRTAPAASYSLLQNIIQSNIYKNLNE